MSFAVCFLIGFVMCIPVGPINIWVMNTYLKKGKKSALAVALGGSSMDFVYFGLILSGLSFLNFGESLTFWLKAIGILVIFFLGLKELITNISPAELEKRKDAGGRGLLQSYFLGVILYTSNPTLLLTMSGLGAFLMSLNLFELTHINIFFSALGISFGAFCWFAFLVQIVARYEEVIKSRFLVKFNRASGFLMIGLSLYMGLRLIY